MKYAELIERLEAAEAAYGDLYDWAHDTRDLVARRHRVDHAPGPLALCADEMCRLMTEADW